MKKPLSAVPRILLSLFFLGILGVILLLGINQYVQLQAKARILSLEEAPTADAIIILGAYVEPDGRLSLLLQDRVEAGLALYQAGKAPKIIVSGDHGQASYDEVNAMKAYLVARGVPKEAVFMDHAGFSTYESLYRARDIFLVQKALVTTQQFHLKRAVFIGEALNMDVYGVAAMDVDYGHSAYFESRETLARIKDFFFAKILKPEPTYLGEVIPVTGDGGLTDDQVH